MEKNKKLLLLGIGIIGSIILISKKNVQTPFTPEILGCTDITASNFDPNATKDDGSCIFVPPPPPPPPPLNVCNLIKFFNPVIYPITIGQNLKDTQYFEFMNTDNKNHKVRVLVTEDINPIFGSHLFPTSNDNEVDIPPGKTKVPYPDIFLMTVNKGIKINVFLEYDGKFCFPGPLSFFVPPIDEGLKIESINNLIVPLLNSTELITMIINSNFTQPFKIGIKLFYNQNMGEFVPLSSSKIITINPGDNIINMPQLIRTKLGDVFLEYALYSAPSANGNFGGKFFESSFLVK